LHIFVCAALISWKIGKPISDSFDLGHFDQIPHAMIALTNDSKPSFATSPIAAAAGGQPRLDEPALVHGAAPKAGSVSLEDAARVIREAAEKLWRGSGSAALSIWQLLVNFFRWITRPFRAAGSPAPAATGQPGAGGLDVNNVMSPLGAGDPGDSTAPTASSQSVVPDDHIGDHPDAEGSAGEGDSLVTVPKLAFPKSFSSSKLSGTLPLDAGTIEGTMERLQAAHPNAEDADPRELPITATVCLLEEFVSKVTQAHAQARALEAQINTHLVALAAIGDTPAEQLLRDVLAGTVNGGLQGDEIRRLQGERHAHEETAAEILGQIENTLLNVKQQGLDVVGIANRAKVGDALPDWSERLERAEPRTVAALTPAERLEMALDVDPEIEADTAFKGPSPERVASLKASLNSNISNIEHEQERPRS
jgi:hypothetical protein